jgi:septal ring factor EnvC (AmiA/AmiB activator)
MPIFLKREHNNRLAFLFGRQTTLRPTSDTVDQLQKQIEQLKFNATQYEGQIAMLSRQLAEARLELARRDLVDAFANAHSPSAMVH